MRLRVVLGIALAISTTAFAGTVSADGYQGSVKDAPLPAPVTYEWSGLSVGAGIGAGKIDTQVKAKTWRKDIIDKKKCYFEAEPDPKIVAIEPIRTCLDQDAPDTFDVMKAKGDDDSWNLFGTLQIGYDRLFGDRFLIGAFADIDFYKDADLSFSSKQSGHAALTGRVERDNIWTVGGRIGVLATERILIYGLAGYSQLNLDGEFTAQFDDPFHKGSPTDIGMKIDKWVGGYTIGGGIEAKLEQRVSLKLEYRFSAFDGAKLKADSVSTDSWTETCCGVDYEYNRTIKEGAKVSFGDTDVHSVRAVLSFKLGGDDRQMASLK